MKKTTKATMGMRLLMVLTMVIAAVLCFGTTTAMAAGVAKVSIDIERTGDLELPEITSNSSMYNVTDVEWKDEGDLEIGDIVTGIVTVKPTSGNNLYVENLSSVETTGAEVDVISIEGWDTQMKITLHYTVRGRMDEPSKAYWDGWVARCSKVNNAEQYEFVLYQDGREVYRDKSSTNSLNLARQLADIYRYDDVYFKVRALNEGNRDSRYVKSKDFDDWDELWEYCEDKDIPVNHNKIPSRPDKPHHNENGIYLPPINYGTSGWVQNADQSWSYYIDGKKATGWHLINGQYYYLNDNGIMLTGWQYINGVWYFFRPDGSMATGWIFTGCKWYWCEIAGNMVFNTWRYINGNYYYFNGSGEAVEGWQTINGQTYYFRTETSEAGPECALAW